MLQCLKCRGVGGWGVWILSQIQAGLGFRVYLEGQGDFNKGVNWGYYVGYMGLLTYLLSPPDPTSRGLRALWGAARSARLP